MLGPEVRVRRRLCWYAVLAATTIGLASASLAAAAESEADRATARRLAAEGLKALDAKDYANAEERFQRADQLYDAPTIVLGLARAQVGLGKFVEAQENYRKLIHENLPANAPDAFRKAQSSAQEEVQGLDAKIAWVSIEIQGTDKAAVTLDGATLPSAALGVKRAVNPGEHTVKASGAGFRDVQRQLRVAAGQSEELKLIMERSAEPASAGRAAPTPGPSAPSSTAQTPNDAGAPMRIAGGVLLGLGGAGLIVGAVSGIFAMNQHSELVDACTGGICPAAEQDTIDGYGVSNNLSTVGFIAGGALAVTGLILVLVAPSDSTEPGASAPATGGVAVRISPTGIGVSAQF